jgi:hypothetical protein
LEEASACFPASLAALEQWLPPWQTATMPPPAVTEERTAKETTVYELLIAAPAGCEGLAVLLEVDPSGTKRAGAPAEAKSN